MSFLSDEEWDIFIEEHESKLEEIDQNNKIIRFKIEE